MFGKDQIDRIKTKIEEKEQQIERLGRELRRAKEEEKEMRSEQERTSILIGMGEKAMKEFKVFIRQAYKYNKPELLEEFWQEIEEIRERESRPIAVKGSYCSEARQYLSSLSLEELDYLAGYYSLDYEDTIEVIEGLSSDDPCLEDLQYVLSQRGTTIIPKLITFKNEGRSRKQIIEQTIELKAESRLTDPNRKVTEEELMLLSLKDLKRAVEDRDCTPLKTKADNVDTLLMADGLTLGDIQDSLGKDLYPEFTSAPKEVLPSGLAEYEEIAVPVLEVIRAAYSVRRSPKTTNNIAVWNLVDSEDHKAKLYLTTGFEWTIEPETHKDEDYFPDDFHCWMSDNCVDTEDLFNSLS